MTTGPEQVKPTSSRLSSIATNTRQTPRTDFGTVMQRGLIRAGSVVADGLLVAAPFVPGSAVISAAIAGATSPGTSGLIGPAYSGGTFAPGATGFGTGAVNGFATTGAGLTAGGAGPAGGTAAPTGSFAPGGTLAVPGARPGLTTNLNQPASNFQSNITPVAGAGAGPTDAFNQMMSATRQMSEFQASFNLQYLQLQEKIQIDTRQFNLISNIMKTKHDASKNALNNLR